MLFASTVGNQLPILLIDFALTRGDDAACWESVTDPLDRLQKLHKEKTVPLGISYRSS